MSVDDCLWTIVLMEECPVAVSSHIFGAYAHIIQKKKNLQNP